MMKFYHTETDINRRHVLRTVRKVFESNEALYRFIHLSDFAYFYYQNKLIDNVKREDYILKRMKNKRSKLRKAGNY